MPYAPFTFKASWSNEGVILEEGIKALRKAGYYSLNDEILKKKILT